jgi:hypothetical protein
MPRLLFLALTAAGLTAAAALTGCTPHIGDKCVLNTDCSIQGTRVCDNSMPNGYCTLFNCTPNSCPDYAVCVMFGSAVPGCPYDGYAAPARTQRTMCLEYCNTDSDCRTQDGYVCRDPQAPPLDGLILDSQWKKTCIIEPDYSRDTWPVGGLVGQPIAPDASVDAAPICQSSGPPVTSFEASTPGED